MKKLIYILLGFAFMLTSCADKLQDIKNDNPYGEDTKKINIQVVYPEEFSGLLRAGVAVNVTNPATGVIYTLLTDKDGKASIDLQYGMYRVSSSDKGESEAGTIPLFNKSVDEVKVVDTLTRDINVVLDYMLSYSSQLVIKEIYFGGCTGPDGKSYQFDKYVQIYNNSNDVAYLDSLCFGTLDPYNAPSSFTPWSYFDANGQRVIMDSIPICEAVWQFPGKGTDFPLKPGEATVLALNGGIDHTILRPQSVDLNVSGYFVCYNPVFSLTTYHPAPGENLAGHWLNLLIKTGKSTAYAFSTQSPTAVLFSIRGVTAQEFVNNPENRMKKPGTAASTDYIMVPSSWVLDGVEVFRSSTSYKRLPATIDASAVIFGAADCNKGKTIHRKVDELATAAANGRIVYMDTNNSGDDFSILESQSIKK